MLRVICRLCGTGVGAGLRRVALALAEGEELVAQVAGGGVDAASELLGAREAAYGWGRGSFVVGLGRRSAVEKCVRRVWASPDGLKEGLRRRRWLEVGLTIRASNHNVEISTIAALVGGLYVGCRGCQLNFHVSADGEDRFVEYSQTGAPHSVHLGLRVSNLFFSGLKSDRPLTCSS